MEKQEEFLRMTKILYFVDSFKLNKFLKLVKFSNLVPISSIIRIDCVTIDYQSHSHLQANSVQI